MFQAFKCDSPASFHHSLGNVRAATLPTALLVQLPLPSVALSPRPVTARDSSLSLKAKLACSPALVTWDGGRG